MSNPEPRFSSRDWVALGIIALTALFTWLFFDRLPDPVPVHWNIHGEADRFASLPGGALILPGLMLGTWLLMKLVPVISPKEFGMQRFLRPFETVMVACIVLLALLHVAILTGTETLMPYALGVFLVVLGNFLAKTEPNFFFGIRTPWTLASAEVWQRTHRLGGWMFTACGLATLVATPFGVGLSVMAGSLCASAVYLIGYSYVIYGSTAH